MAVTQLVPLDTYLNTSYRPDVEFIDGLLCEKPMTGYPHGVVQVVIAEWFRTRRKEWNISCSVETRTQVSASRVRLPDVIVIERGTAPKHTIITVPILAIEVKSPWDRMPDLEARARDLAALGTKNIWLIDPDQKSISIWIDEQWVATQEKIIRVAGSDSLYLDMEWVWHEVDDSQ